MSQPDITKNPEVQALTAQTDQFAAIAQTYKVTTAVQYEDAGEQLKQIKAAMKRLDDLRKSITKPMDAAKKVVMDFFRGPEEKLARAESGVKRAMIAYSDEQDRIRREEQRRAEEIARKERERIEAQAREAARRAQEEQDRLRREAAAAEAAGRAAEAAKLAAKAAAVQEKGEAKAAALEERAACVVAPIIQRETPRIAGQRETENWTFEIADPAKVNPAFMTPDLVKIGKCVRAMKGDAQPILGEGVRVICKKGLASSAA